jgi:hypothetical protein
VHLGNKVMCIIKICYCHPCFMSSHTPKFLDRLNCKSKGENNERIMNWGTFPNTQHFEGRGVCWSFGMGTRRIGNWVNYSHGPAQTKQQVSWCIVGAFLVHGRAMGTHGFTILTKAWTWGKPPPSPL